MFTQLFGNYLLNQRLVSAEQLAEALELQKTTRLKLGVLAINAGYMTADQVEMVHAAQQRVNMRIGDIAVQMGFLTHEHVEELLSSQKSGHLLLGQALVDKGYMTTAQFEQALRSYKAENSITDSDFTSAQADKESVAIRRFYNLDALRNTKYYTEYISLLYNNIIRFIGNDFTPLDPEPITEYSCMNAAVQKITGTANFVTAIEANDNEYIDFAARYAGEPLNCIDEMTNASVGEFLNLQNGLFTVNISNDTGIELKLDPQETSVGAHLENLSEAFRIPFAFPFGTVNFIIASV